MGEPGAALAQAISPRELDGRYDERIKVDDELVLSLSLSHGETEASAILDDLRAGT